MSTAPAPTTTPAARPAAADDALSVEVLDGEAVIWDARSQELHHLNAATTAEWQNADAGDPSALSELIAAGLLPGRD